MLLEFFIIFEVVMLITFFIAFYTKQEVIWAISFLLSGVLMIVSWYVEILQYVFDPATGSYALEAVYTSYPVLSGINFLFFALALVFGVFDIFDKYGLKLGNFKKKFS